MAPVAYAARKAVALSFFLNGFAFASWVSRIPEVRQELSLSNGALGLLLLALSAGSVLTLPTTGALIQRWGADRVVRAGALSAAVGMVVAAVGVGFLGSVALTAVGLFFYGLGTGSWDVAMNVEGAAVERRIGRTIMPRFHAGFSLGTVAGALVGALTAATELPIEAHLGAVAVVILTGGVASTTRFLAGVEPPSHDPAGRRTAWAAWLEPRTLLVGLMVFALAVTEGTANDWLAVALEDGHDVERWVAVAGFGLFVTAMTTGRLVGPPLLDRFGRLPVLWSTMATAGAGVLLIVYGDRPLVVLGIVLWGLGASLGFPIGMSAAADDETHAAARVSVVASIAYTAFLVGPPFIGFVADHTGTLPALLVVAFLLIPSALVVPAARDQRAHKTTS
ncbi:MFS transporter [Nocardioides speluncae]|uniref:MFS transporter n=1 Tax=Nocardioides speluncae TaxID=2670337 RepID=UPI001F0CA21B|nr:MFS transporter [Nocardioides speluncae]